MDEIATSKKAANDFRVYAEFDRREMLPFVPKSAKVILDVGCGVGNFGQILKNERNSEVWGVDADSEAVAIAATRLDKVYLGPFDEKAALPTKTFDCIVFNDVLEHMVDPNGALIYAKSLLSPGGKIVASIPNVRYFGNIWNLVYHKSWDYTDTGILDRTHLRFFTKSSILSTFESLGFVVESIMGINRLEECTPYLARRYAVLKFLTAGHIEDMGWLQFAVVASVKSQ